MKILSTLFRMYLWSILALGMFIQFMLMKDFFFEPSLPSETPEHHQQVTDSVLHTCYPAGIYNADAAPICPDVYKIIEGNLNQGVEP